MTQSWSEAALNSALDIGAAAAEAYAHRGEQLSVGVLDGEVDTHHASLSAGLSLRVTKNGQTGYAYTQAPDRAQELAEQACANAEVLENGDEHPYYAGGVAYEHVKRGEGELAADKAAQYALELERLTLGVDRRVSRVRQCKVFSYTSQVTIHNTLGLCAERAHKRCGAYVMPIVEDKGEVRDSFAFRLGLDWTRDMEALAKEAVGGALDQLGARSLPAKAYATILRYDAAVQLLCAFAGLFSAENAQKGLSLLKGRVGENVASSLLTLVDDPLCGEGYACAPFDDEGAPSQHTVLLKGGTLRTLLHNLKTARKDGVRTTANAGKASAESPIGVSPSQMFFQPGGEELDALCQKMRKGLLITDLSGLHAGANPVSGDFSLLCRGFWIEDGQRAYPVEQITAAGNFLEVLERVVAVGSDLYFDMPGAQGCIGSPSLWLESLQIAGK